MDKVSSCRDCMLKDNEYYSDNLQIQGGQMSKMGVVMFMVVAIMMVVSGNRQQTKQTAIAL